MNGPNLQAMLGTLDTTLAASLEHSRASFRHSVLRGDGAESAFRQALDSHLPRYLAVGTGEVIDQSDTRSGQVDVVIANEDQPFRTAIHEPGAFLIEGVGAAGEVKSQLTTAELSRALDGRDRGILSGANASGQMHFFNCPPYFLLLSKTS